MGKLLWLSHGPNSVSRMRIQATALLLLLSTSCRAEPNDLTWFEAVARTALPESAAVVVATLVEARLVTPPGDILASFEGELIVRESLWGPLSPGQEIRTTWMTVQLERDTRRCSLGDGEVGIWFLSEEVSPPVMQKVGWLSTPARRRWSAIRDPSATCFDPLQVPFLRSILEERGVFVAPETRDSQRGEHFRPEVVFRNGDSSPWLAPGISDAGGILRVHPELEVLLAGVTSGGLTRRQRFLSLWSPASEVDRDLRISVPPRSELRVVVDLDGEKRRMPRTKLTLGVRIVPRKPVEQGWLSWEAQ